MPELPEVETAKRGITPFVLGQTVKQLIVRNHSLRWPILKNLPELVAHKKVVAIDRRSKYLMLSFSEGFLIIHLGMSGTLRVINANTPAAKHDHVDMILDSGKCLRYTDPRRFGCWLWSSQPEVAKLLNKLGPEPLTDDFELDRFINVCKQRSAPIKNVIMDNSVVVGVGNIYAAESLFDAGIKPQKRSNKVSKKSLERLHGSIQRILAKAISAGGTSLKDFTKTDGKPGYFRQELMVYGRENENCYICQTPLKGKRIGQRATVFCPNCQS
ncbi:MAG: bifunctional DNA-formamidopyrimidine glycosylase/DNA-(apurinic or apyrimidinic site) lyase [Kangiellaceae bacterium]|jgi:formamidopyrimidine-DNA glycosylase|nr:bifunctional DNA-formamidopyrimidine glycosylase/DNA-(apurinic or apyrimidinic site) lyase [Kangiellaceae bacterium]